ncbi:hypothetical protein CUMW_114620 [Citrus unshiu]|nr:hypothetical protein CUMW_114620 [Citrus unshiu]
MASSRINFAEVYSFFNDESRLGDVLQTLEPNSKESSRKYWLFVKDYLPSIPDWVHKHQPSINAMPSDSSLFDKFDRWFTGDSRVRRRVQHPRSFFQIILGTTSMGWLGDGVFLNQLWNNGNCAVDSMVFDDRLNSYLCGRQHTIYSSLLTWTARIGYKLKFKPLEVIFPRWLEYVGFYNIRPELRSEDPWKVIAVKSAPQQEPGTGDCDLCSNFNVEI